MEYDHFLRLMTLCEVFNNVPAAVVDKTRYISVTHLCKLLGIQAEPQRKKLRNKDWANGRVFYLLNDVTREIRPYYMIDAPTLQRWLDELNTRWITDKHQDIHELLQYDAAASLEGLEP